MDLDVHARREEAVMSIKRIAASGVKWTAVSAVVSTIVQFAQIAILARLLRPEDFGLMGMIAVVLGFAQTYSDMGVSNAIIYRQDATSEQLSSLYWLNIFAGVSVFLLVLLSRPLVVLLFSEPRLESLLLPAAFLFLITPLGQQFQVLLQKELRFNVLSSLEMVSSVFGAIVSVWCALLGFGVYSLIWGQLGNAALKTLILLFFGLRIWRPALRFRTSDMRGYVKFGMYQLGQNSVNYFNAHLDKLIIGSMLGAQMLGYYDLAFRLVIRPVIMINPIVTRVAFPVFARVQDDAERLKRGFLAMMRALTQINYPILIGFAVVAPQLVPLVFGAQWQPSVILIQILAFVALMRATGNPVGSLILAKGRADLGFKFNLLISVSTTIGILIGISMGGLLGVAISLLVLQAAYFVLNYYYLVRAVIGPCLRQYIASFSPSFLYSLIMALIVGLMAFLPGGHTRLMLIGQVITGVIIYVGLVFFLQRRQLKEVFDLFFSRG